MREELHTIVDLCLALEEICETHTSVSISPHVNMINVEVWEGNELSDETALFRDYAFYDGELKDQQAVRGIIQALEELRDAI